MYILVIVTLPLATAITIHRSAVLSGSIVQVTVMLYSSLVTLGEMSVAEVLVTEDATYHDRDTHKNYIRTSPQLRSYIQ